MEKQPSNKELTLLLLASLGALATGVLAVKYEDIRDKIND